MKKRRPFAVGGERHRPGSAGRWWSACPRTPRGTPARPHALLAAPLSVPLVALLLPSFGPGALQAQATADARDHVTVVGEILDATTSTPLPAVRVVLRPVPPEEDDDADAPPRRASADTLRLREAVTDARGRFVLEDVRMGRYTVEAGSLGFGEVIQEVAVRGASPFEIRIRLAPAAVELEGVVVTSVRSPRLAASGFYERRGRTSGDFLTYEEIQERGATRTADLLGRFAGVRTVQPARGGAPFVTLRGGCRPDIVVDGLNLGPNLSPDDVISPRELEGVELYRGPGSPIQLSRSTCGAVLLWSADPALRAEDGRPMSWGRFLAAAAFVAGAILLTR